VTDPIRVVVVDDQRIVREGLVLILDLLPAVEVVGTAGDGEQALSVVAAQRPDVVLMDLRMPRMDGAEATAQIRARHPGTEVVVLTTYVDDTSVLAALRAGARGYLTKDARPAEIAAAITAVRNGQSQLDPGVQRRLVDALAAGTPAPPDGLTAREVEVLVLIAEGRTNAEIAARLVISAATTGRRPSRTRTPGGSARHPPGAAPRPRRVSPNCLPDLLVQSRAVERKGHSSGRTGPLSLSSTRPSRSRDPLRWTSGAFVRSGRTEVPFVHRDGRESRWYWRARPACRDGSVGRQPGPVAGEDPLSSRRRARRSAPGAGLHPAALRPAPPPAH
jgi:DNA-binding NarL/FixJ family response regulator